ncbi:penicillin-binding protein [Paenibacillus alkaliterrae]|uniref:peptidoglycan D,D-transpeptidase FtsI family protein n=1 Tax=Paenibacillus alkaliterrae TaxID=320909 RepID=UPI001F21F66C|nr:penicillin-binding transpeptidase domain-containing protein [Paenibacillus alkaliterrae]MCF2937238.1 penicillin-binding protein [Paenibacillus alkaliterrae]
MFKRIWVAALLISMVMLLYIGRLAWLQLMPGSSSAAVYSRSSSQGGWQRLSVMQRQRNLVLDTGRGDFYDRYGLPITGETYSTVALFPVRGDARGEKEELAKLSALLGVTAEQLTQRWDAVREPIFWQTDGNKGPVRLSDEQVRQIKRLGLNGIRVLPYRNRYLPDFEAKHVIGFTSQHPEWLMAEHPDELVSGKRKLTEQVGGAGLEKSLDMLLRGVGSTSVSYFMDGRNAPLHGLDLRLTQPGNRYYPLKAITTLDLKLQNEIEAYADAQGLREGSIVVLDADNADIVAMVSRPKLKPGQFQSADGSEWENHALKAVAPGSVFKLVTEAAALEAGVTDRHDTFFCDGEYGKYGLSCWKEGGHGLLTLEEGLAQSCNIAFATIAERLNAFELQSTANALGIAHKAGWHRERAFGPFAGPLRLLEEEEAGALFAPAAKAAETEAVQKRRGKEAAMRTERKRAASPAPVDGGVLAQSGIGQRDVRMSPLQAANLIVTLLNRGRVMEPRLVSEIRYASGQRMVKLPAQRAQGTGGRIKPATAHALLRGMEAVVDHGTGRSIRQGLWAVAGKSGTAETVRAGAARNHQWFAGYGPVKQPRYAIAVLVENQPPGSANQATKLFRGVMDIAARLNKRQDS